MYINLKLMFLEMIQFKIIIKRLVEIRTFINGQKNQ